MPPPQAFPSYSQMAQGPPGLSLKKGDQLFLDVPMNKCAHVHQIFFREDHRSTVTKAATALVAVVHNDEKPTVTLRAFLQHVVQATCYGIWK